jgi:hypothetical protein
MKKNLRKSGNPARIGVDDILPEYDFSHARPNPYAAHYKGRLNVVALDPDVAAVFQDPGEVNEALRALAQIIYKHRGRRGTSSLRSPQTR